MTHHLWSREQVRVNDQKKDIAVTTAATALAVVGVAAGVGAAIPGGVGLALQRLYDRRTKKWWALVVERSLAPEELAARIAAGLAEDDEHVVAGVVGRARAAASAVELSAVVVIAELSRRHFEAQDLPRWFFRAALTLFEQLEASELYALRRLLVEAAPIRSDEILIAGDIEGEATPWRASQLSVLVPFEHLTPFDSPRRLFGYLKRCGLGHESPGVGFVGSPAHVVIERQVADWLRDALSIEEAATIDGSVP